MATVLHLMLSRFHHFTALKRILETRPVLLQSSSYNTITVQVISKSIGFLPSHRSLNIQNIAFKQRSFSALWEKLNMTNVKNNLIYQPLMYTAFGLQNTKGFFKAVYAHQTTERLALFTYFLCLCISQFQA